MRYDIFKKKESDDFTLHFSLIHSNCGGHNDIKEISITHIASI